MNDFKVGDVAAIPDMFDDYKCLVLSLTSTQVTVFVYENNFFNFVIGSFGKGFFQKHAHKIC